jgi:hypothetical protein
MTTPTHPAETADLDLNEPPRCCDDCGSTEDVSPSFGERGWTCSRCADEILEDEDEVSTC